MTHATEQFMESTTMRALLNLPDAYLDQAMALAYQAFQSRRLAEADILCRGLLAADHRYWWSYSLHAAVLRKLGRYGEALSQVEHGLKYEPNQPKLLQMRAELREAINRLEARQSTSGLGMKAAVQGSVTREATQ